MRPLLSGGEKSFNITATNESHVPGLIKTGWRFGRQHIEGLALVAVLAFALLLWYWGWLISRYEFPPSGDPAVLLRAARIAEGPAGVGGLPAAQPPGIPALLAVLERTTGLSGSDLFIHLHLLTFGLFIPLAMYFFLSKSIGPRAGIFAILFWAGSPVLYRSVWFGQLSEAVALFLAVVLFALYLRRTGGGWRLPAMALLALGVLLAHFMTAFVTLSVLALHAGGSAMFSLRGGKQDLRAPLEALVALAMAGLVVLGTIPHYRDLTSDVWNLVTPHLVGGGDAGVAGPGIARGARFDLSSFPEFLGREFMVLATLFSVVAVLYAVTVRRRSEPVQAFTLLVAWLLILFGLSQLGTSFPIANRFVRPMSIPLAMLAGVGLSHALRGCDGRAAGIGAQVLVSVMIAALLVPSFIDRAERSQNFNLVGAAELESYEWIKANTDELDVVLTPSPYDRWLSLMTAREVLDVPRRSRLHLYPNSDFQAAWKLLDEPQTEAAVEIARELGISYVYQGGPVPTVRDYSEIHANEVGLLSSPYFNLAYENARVRIYRFVDPEAVDPPSSSVERGPPFAPLPENVRLSELGIPRALGAAALVLVAPGLLWGTLFRQRKVALSPEQLPLVIALSIAMTSALGYYVSEYLRLGLSTWLALGVVALASGVPLVLLVVAGMRTWRSALLPWGPSPKMR